MSDDSNDSTSGDRLHDYGLRRGDDGHDDRSRVPDAGPGFAGRSRGNGGTRTAADDDYAGPPSAGRPVGPVEDAAGFDRHSAREPGEPPPGRFVAYTGWVDVDTGLGFTERFFIDFNDRRPTLDRPFRPTVIDYGVDWFYDLIPGDHRAAFDFEYDSSDDDLDPNDFDSPDDYYRAVDNHRSSDDDDKRAAAVDNHDGEGPADGNAAGSGE